MKHCQRHGPEKDPYCVDCWKDERERDALGPSDATACSAAPDDFEERMMEMDIHELRSRILTQRDYLKKLHSCLDGLEIPAGCNSNLDGCRDHRDIRWIVKKLLSRLPNACALAQPTKTSTKETDV